MTELSKGIDVSENNLYIDWNRLQHEGVKFAYVRSSYGKTGKDSMFLANVNAAHEHGMLVGAYHYSYALTPADAVKEAKNCRKVIDDAGVLLELPVFFDMEDADGYKHRHGFTFTRDNITRICKAFGDNIGLNWGVYASLSWLEDYIDWKSLGCPVWNAQWGPHDDFGGFVWQYTDSFLGENLDGDYMYDHSLFE